MNDRERMLKELNLYPMWVRRDPPAEDAHDDVPAAQRGGTVQSVADERSLMTLSTKAPPATPIPAAPPARPATGIDDQRARAIASMDWPALKQAVGACNACPLHAQRKQSVFGVGDEAADWLLVGEGPGAEEDARGEPFVGQAGRLLDNMLAAIGLARGQDVYIANIVKCRPPGNRVPEPLEARCCEPYLERQIALLRPRLIVALGKTAAENLLRREASIASLRGRLHDYNGISLIVTYHPAYLLRNLPDKAKAWEDLCFARDTMQRLKSDSAAAT